MANEHAGAFLHGNFGAVDQRCAVHWQSKPFARFAIGRLFVGIELAIVIIKCFFGFILKEDTGTVVIREIGGFSVIGEMNVLMNTAPHVPMFFDGLVGVRIYFYYVAHILPKRAPVLVRG